MNQNLWSLNNIGKPGWLFLGGLLMAVVAPLFGVVQGAVQAKSYLPAKRTMSVGQMAVDPTPLRNGLFGYTSGFGNFGSLGIEVSQILNHSFFDFKGARPVFTAEQKSEINWGGPGSPLPGALELPQVSTRVLMSELNPAFETPFWSQGEGLTGRLPALPIPSTDLFF